MDEELRIAHPDEKATRDVGDGRAWHEEAHGVYVTGGAPAVIDGKSRDVVQAVETLRRTPMLVGQAPPLRPELAREWDVHDGGTHRLMSVLTALMAAGIVFVAVMVWLNLTHKL